MIRRVAAIRAFALALSVLLVAAAWADERKPPQAAIASAYPLATQAGMEILDQGGNAFDAAVAVSAALAVVEPKASSLGAGGFFLLHRGADGTNVFVDAREVAPLAATRDMFLDADGSVVKGRSTSTALAAGIPGEVAGWGHLAGKYGRLPLAQSLAPAIRLARSGFPAYAQLRDEITAKRSQFEKTVDGRKTYLPGGDVPAVGHVMKMPELARTLEMISRKGADSFYHGPFARKLIDGVHELGGIWSLEDLAQYRVIERRPLVGDYRGVRIITAPPPSSGGIALIDGLNILSGYALDKLDSASRKHLIIETLRRVHRDRAEYLGDPDYVSMPLDRLLSPYYAAGQRASIRLDRATPSSMLPGYSGSAAGTDTTHFSVLDREGNRVAGTVTLNSWFGTALMITGTGVLLNNEMDDFAVKPGAPNIYELVGADANSVAPRKRPLSSMTPSFIESDKGLMITGSPGGSFIPTMVLLGTLNWLSGADATAVVAAPRFHHQYQPDVVFAEDAAFTVSERAQLEKLGHSFRSWPRTIGNMQVVTWDYANGKVDAASDPRRAGGSLVK
ncbi:MAG TPA: gamma-glutamyltransferase [Steroidobacteraceae bacterium]|nr:gamma-glutamyltransferase [Steroidobacteraceae bacterium]